HKRRVSLRRSQRSEHKADSATTILDCRKSGMRRQSVDRGATRNDRICRFGIDVCERLQITFCASAGSARYGIRRCGGLISPFRQRDGLALEGRVLHMVGMLLVPRQPTLATVDTDAQSVLVARSNGSVP